MQLIYLVLENLGIKYEKHTHPAVFTMEEAARYDRDIEAGKSKNLFLRNKKGDTHYLLVVESTKQVDLQKLGGQLRESRLSFASPERLQQFLKVSPGSVSPFGLVNDIEHVVRVMVDADLLRYDRVAYHPNINTETLVVSTKDFKRFLEWTGNSIEYVSL